MPEEDEQLQNDPNDIRYTFDSLENGINEEDLIPTEPDTESIYGEIIEPRVFLPFVRLISMPKYFATDELLKHENKYLIEVIFVLLVAISYIFWPDSKQTITQYFMFASWVAVIMYLLGLAYANLKTNLLPDKILVGLFVASMFFVMTKTIDTNNIHVLWSSVLGFIVAGLVPWIVYQITKGRYIGGGVVKTAAVVGFLLGIKLGIICLLLVIILSIIYHSMVNLIFKKNKSTRIVETGVIWLIVVLVLQLFGTSFVN